MFPTRLFTSLQTALDNGLSIDRWGRGRLHFRSEAVAINVCAGDAVTLADVHLELGETGLHVPLLLVQLGGQR